MGVIVLFSATSCHITEDIYIKEDGSGYLGAEVLRDENAYLQFQGDDYVLKEEYVDSAYVMKDVIENERATFDRFMVEDQDLLMRYSGVKVHLKKDSFSKEYKVAFSQSFGKIEDVEDLSKLLDYVDDLKYNYVMDPQGKRTHLSYTFDENVFRRNFKILNQKEFDSYKDQIQNARQLVNISNFSYTANYHFPRKIKKVSHPDAVISSDGKTLTLKQSLIDCLDNPDLAILEVVLENKE